ncbi:hypothetical protein Pmani_004814 [Petrolisthes manimaculis]|uniref:Uncharacterized protein n=1 Tax=Petrolisthes manimaculis TaxID=1843537 RepID=A0AAE1QDG8_9EUCA|nr:hypothetical protein Pmani_004814 [Petrolisthes manimaculis]
MGDNVDERSTVDGRETVVGKWIEVMEGKEEVERGKEEVERGKEEAERGKEEVEGRKEEAERKKEEVEGRKKEVEGRKEEAERGKGEGEGEEGEGGEINQDLSTFEDLLEAVIGERGRWNYLLYFICSYGSLVSALQTMSYQVLGATPDYWCQVDQLLAAKWTTQQILNFAIPFKRTGKRDQS